MSKVAKALSVARSRRKKFADGGDTLPDVGDAMIGDGGEFSPGTKLGNKATDVGSKLGYGMMTGAATTPYSIMKNMVEGSQDSMGGNGVGEVSPKSIQGSGDLVMQGVGQAAGVRPSATTAGVFVGPYGAHMLRDADRSAAMPHPVVGEEIRQRASSLRPEFQDIYKGAAQDMRDAQARGTLEMRDATGNAADRDVWANSGWSRGSEGMIKKEIPDTGAKLVKLKGTDKYVLEHPAGDLHEIYGIPPIQVDRALKATGMRAGVDPETNQITLSDPKDVSAALHEVQHAIQRSEGFASGSNLETAQFSPAMKSEYFPTSGFPSPEEVPSWQKGTPDKPNVLDPQTLTAVLDPRGTAVRQSYLRSAGEAEARNVQDRRAKSFRYQSHPEDTEDVGRGLQWVDDRYIPRTYDSRSAGDKFLDRAKELVRKPYADGGNVGNFNPERGAAMGLAREGMIKSSIPGRTDKLNLNVPAGSYILPADIPSALGQGNTMAGGSILQKMFTKGPYGMNLPKASAGSRVGSRHSSLSSMHFAKGGAVGQPTPIVAAGGEYILHPDTVAALGHGDIELGHSILDAFVKHIRSKHISTLKGLKPPKGSK